MFLLCGELLIQLDDHFAFIITAEVEEPLPHKEERIHDTLSID